MVYALDISKHADRIFRKLAKKDKVQLEAINNKIDEILENPQHFKPLKGDMKGSRRVHFDPFVLVYEIDESTKTVTKLLHFIKSDVKADLVTNYARRGLYENF